MRLAGTDKKEAVKMLQARIDAIQGLGKVNPDVDPIDLAPFAQAFPNGAFPIGAIHELISYEPAGAASTTGFIAAISAKLIQPGALCLWFSTEMKVFPIGLKNFGISPDCIVFLNIPKRKELLWALEEALKCRSLAVVVGEISQLSFSESRRLQLAVESSCVTGFIHRYRPYAENAVACTTRWKISPLSTTLGEIPGIGHSRWEVQLVKVRNGRPRNWQVTWMGGQFTQSVDRNFEVSTLHQRHTGS